MTPPPTRTTLTARSPEDLLALVPIVLGFVPHDSVVMLTFGADRPFHARVDLPRGAAEVHVVVAALLEPARLHRVRRVVFVVYATADHVARTLAAALAGAFEDAGIDVAEVLRADGRRWFTLLGDRPGVPRHGVAYDVSAHRFAAQAVVEGRVTHGSRAELAESLRSDPDRVARVAAAVADLPAPGPDPALPPWAGPAWATRLVSDHVVAGTAPGDADLARLLVGMSDARVRDAAWMVMTRESAREHVEFWSGVVRRTPRPLLAAPAAVLGFAAWLSGQGALAWCAIDRCREADPGYRLGELLAGMLVRAVPPSVWEGWDPADDLA